VTWAPAGPWPGSWPTCRATGWPSSGGHLQRGTVAGYEALSRFAGPPDAGPDVWFEAAGRHGLGAELDARVLERVVGLRPELPRTAS
jgi:hypothetical protein